MLRFAIINCVRLVCEIWSINGTAKYLPVLNKFGKCGPPGLKRP